MNEMINELREENAKLRERLGKVEAERDEVLTWVAHFQECSRDECMCGNKMSITCGQGGCTSTADYHAFPNAKRELKRRDIEQQIKGAEDSFIAGYEYALKPVTSMHSRNQMLERAKQHGEQLRKELEK